MGLPAVATLGQEWVLGHVMGEAGGWEEQDGVEWGRGSIAGGRLSGRHERALTQSPSLEMGGGVVKVPGF